MSLVKWTLLGLVTLPAAEAVLLARNDSDAVEPLGS